MSWMVLHGRLYHCTGCGRSFQIEYLGGSRPVQVSDPVIMQQRELQLRYGGDTEVLHDEGLCGDCVAAAQRTHAGDTVSPEVFMEISQLATTLQKSRSAVATRLHLLRLVDWGKAIRNLDFHGLCTIAPDAFKATIGSPSFSAQTAAALSDRFFSDAAPALGAFGLSVSGERLDAAFDESRAGIATARQRLQELLALGGHYTYVERDLRSAQNLNPFISYEHTVRTPDPSATPYRFFDEYELDRTAAENLVAAQDAPVDDSAIGAMFVEDLRKVLTPSALLAMQTAAH